MSQLTCKRCGIDTDTLGWCDDCKEVEGVSQLETTQDLKERVRDLYRSGMRQIDISRQLNVPRARVCEWVHLRYKTSISTEKERNSAKYWFELGVPTKEVAEELGRTTQTVLTWACDGGWERFYWADAKGVRTV